MTLLYVFYRWLIRPMAMRLSVIGLIVFPRTLIFPTIRHPYLDAASSAVTAFSFLVFIAHGLHGLGLLP